ncbi:MAG: [LysW]-lysine hydrolase [Anaerolineae bacterium]|nr:[LysW]-lysine hydrolase [Anaerolineae bacterium]
MSDDVLLEGLLTRYSPTFDEHEAVTFLVTEMNHLGYQAFVDEVGNAVGVRGEGPRTIMLLGHIDTVPGYINVRYEDDFLYGRGSVDAKGPLACFTAAAARVTPPPGWKLIVIGAVGEEGNSRGAQFVRDHYRPDAVIIGEPSKWERITLGFKGSLWCHYSVSHSQTHSAHSVESACEAAVRFWNEVSAWCRSIEPEGPLSFYQLTPSLRSMHSDASDGFNETAEVHINLRLPPAVSVQAVTARLSELAGDGVLEVEDGAVDAYRSDKNNFAVRSMLAAIRQAGGTPGFTVKTGTSDMNVVVPVWRCPTLAYGPGDSSLDHTPNEHISISEYHQAIEVLSTALALMMKD